MLIQRAHEYDTALPTKSGLMLGLGEEQAEVEKALEDLAAAGCSILTLGQYLQPSKNHLPVERFIPPEEFEAWRQKALAIGFAEVASGPFVRSSYHAQELFREVKA
jgi:lipoic acid synthetase